MAGLYPLSRQQQFDLNGRLLDGAQLFLYDGGTTTPRVGYADFGLSSPLPWPIQADASGRLPLIYLDDGFYRHRLTNKNGALIFDDDGLPVLSTGGGGSGTTVDPNSLFLTRDIKIKFGSGPINGYVRLNGRSIGSTSSGATERANLDTRPLYEELWPFSNISVVGGKGASSTDDWVANKQLILPDAAGRLIGGFDNLGAGRKNRITDATINGADVVGAGGGFEKFTIAKTHLPAYNLTGPAVSVSVSGTTAGMSANATHNHSGTTGGMTRNNPHSHSYSRGSGHLAWQPSATFSLDSLENATTGATDINHEHNFSTNTVNLNHTHSFSGSGSTAGLSVSTGGGGVALPTMPPALLFMIYIRL